MIAEALSSIFWPTGDDSDRTHFSEWPSPSGLVLSPLTLCMRLGGDKDDHDSRVVTRSTSSQLIIIRETFDSFILMLSLERPKH